MASARKSPANSRLNPSRGYSRTTLLRTASGTSLPLPIDWATEQFRALGVRDPHDQAVALIAAYQGIALLTQTLADPDLMTREGRRLERWIDGLTR